MKILVLQTARFGDIFQTWPILSALKRKYPLAELHCLVREKYSEAARMNPLIDKLWALPVRDILGPMIVDEKDGLENSLIQVDRFLNQISGNYDQIINLSFSPLSSFVVDHLKGDSTVVMGYDRFSDGYLNISDDPSAYFYAQAGVGKFNRVHLIDLMALVAQVDLRDEDFSPQVLTRPRSDQEYVVFHVGASRPNKTLCHLQWRDLVHSVLKITDLTIYICGTNDEKVNFGEFNGNSRLIDLCGKTKMSDLFDLVSGARALVAGDSLLVQIANLTQTLTLNLSCAAVNFWETGPRAVNSMVMYRDSMDDFTPLGIRRVLMGMLRGGLQPENGSYFYDSAMPVAKYRVESSPAKVSDSGDGCFQWDLIRAMYLGERYPILEDLDGVLAFGQLNELAKLAMENILELKKNPKNQVSMGLLDEVDGLTAELARRCPLVAPLVWWMSTEKSRVGPDSVDEVFRKTLDVFEQLESVSRLYTYKEEIPVKMERRDLSWK